MAPIWSVQPFKTLYTIYTVAKIPVLLPLLALRYSLPSFRPFPQWSLFICVHNAVIRAYVTYLTTVRSTLMSAVESDHAKAKDQFAVAEPADPALYSGILAPRDAIRPVPVGGLWFPRAPADKDMGADGDGDVDLRREKVILHIPGGAFVLAFGSRAMAASYSSVLLEHLKADRAFVPQYRVAVRFPAAVQDLLTCYLYILSLGYAPENVILSGDSAAGNIVLALLRHLEASPSPNPNPSLPKPSAVTLWSPWVHVTPSAGLDFERSANAGNDVLTGPFLQWGADAYLPNAGDAAFVREARPYVSPLHHPFRLSVPVFVNAGTGEGFFDAVRSFAMEMRVLNGDRVLFHPTELAPHGIVLAHTAYGMTAQLVEAVGIARRFFEEYL
ncbi:alpha/beta-hydrolase [Hypoxylon sp. NC1633]|nr:alpha/beta-hydrolase [Hypoxylon sp. NC1633]